MTEIIEALNKLEKEKGISKDVMIDAIEKAIISACEKDFGKDAVKAVMDPESGEITVTAPKQVVDEINDPNTDILIEDAKHIDPDCELDDFVECEIKTIDFGRIAAQKARGIILQSLKENERKAVYDYFKDKAKVSFGIGTFVSNDTYEEALNIVIKLQYVNGRPVAKLSDSPGKSMCRNEEFLDYLRRSVEYRLTRAKMNHVVK